MPVCVYEAWIPCCVSAVHTHLHECSPSSSLCGVPASMLFHEWSVECLAVSSS